MRKLLKKYGFVPDKLVTDDLKSYTAAASELRLARRHERGRWRNNRGEGPTRKRALLHHFGTLKAIERASVTDLMQVEGISAETARRIYEFFHEGAA